MIAAVQNGMGTVTRLWPSAQRPAIEAAEPPEYRRDFPELLEMAETMLASRKTAFPQQIQAGAITDAEAAAQLRIFEDIAADWRFIVTGRGQPASCATLPDRRAALDTSLATIASIAADQGGFSDTLAHQTQCVIAMRWHLEPGRQTIPLARFSHQLRAEAAAQAKEQANGQKTANAR